MVANAANRLRHFCVFGKAKDHYSKKEDELFSSLKDGDIGIADRAYNHFKALYRQTTRGVFFVVLAKAGMKHKVVKKVPKTDLGANILSDGTIRLTGQRTSKEYPGELRRVGARVQLLALRRTRQGHRLAEEGRDGDPALLWDSTTPRLRRHRIGNAVFAGFREDVPEVCGIAKRRFAGRWQGKSSHATENGIS